MEPTNIRNVSSGRNQDLWRQVSAGNEIRKIEATLAQHNRPVAIGIPGYVLPMDIDGRLFVSHKRKVKSFAVDPAGTRFKRRRRDTTKVESL